MRRQAAKSKPAPKVASAPVTGRPLVPVWLMAALLALVTIALYWPVTRHDFVDYDDEQYVTQNPHVTSGLTLENARWAFGSGYVANWHPVTWLSHELDCQLFGLNPWGHHLTSVVLHALNALLVFALLQQMTGARWRSLLVAALFALHPLRVESVAWVAERKDVLSGFFGLLSLVFYVRYARQSGVPGAQLTTDFTNPPSPSYGGQVDTDKKKERIREIPEIRGQNCGLLGRPAVCYVLALVLFALGLMSKPMLVTWPFVMLLLDYWPMRRLSLPISGPSNPPLLHHSITPLFRLVWEKVPFFTLVAAVSVATFLVQRHGGTVVADENLPLGVRSGNALISYCRYLGKVFWPTDLAVFYPYPGQWPLGTVLLAGGLVLGISALFFAQRRRTPFLLVGWLWFVGMLVPVIGLVQAGAQAMADRYTYLPSLGVLILAVWGACELTRCWRYSVIALAMAGSAAIVLCLALTRQQIDYWKDSESLFQHALGVTENNYLAYNTLGTALDKQGRIEEAIRQYQEAIRLRPKYPDAHNNLGVAFDKQGRIEEAIRQYQEAVRLKPDYADAHYNLGVAFDKQGRIEEAIRQYQEAVRLNPDSAKAHNNLGAAFGNKGQITDAIRQYQEAVRLKPDNAEAHNNLATALEQQGQIGEAVRQYQEAIRLRPDNIQACYNLGCLWAEHGQNLDQACALFAKAVQLEPKNAAFLHRLGWVLFELNRPREALDCLLQAIEYSAQPDASLYDHLGDVYAALKQFDKAADAWRKSLSVEPNRDIQKKLGDLPAH